MNEEARTGVKAAGNCLLIQVSPRIWPRETWAAKLYVYAASSLIGHSSFACHAGAQRRWVIHHFPARRK